MDTDNYKLGKWIENWGSGRAKTITLIVTENCNLSCKYCYLCGKNDKRRMSFDVARKCVDYVLENRRLFYEDSAIWDFMGGEPFLEIDLIDAICDYIKQRTYLFDHPWFNNYMFSLSTNGILYHTEPVQSFIRKNHEHLSVGLSIDGSETKHNLQRVYPNGEGSYRDVVRNVPLWLEQFPHGSTKSTLSHECLPFIKESVISLWNLGIKDVFMNTVFENAWIEGDDAVFESQIRALGDHILENCLWGDYNCSLFTESIGYPMNPMDNQNWCGPGKMLAIDADGTFYPCNRFVKFSLNKKKPRAIGNYTDGLDTNRLRPFLVLDRYTQSTKECFDCEVARGCAWCTGHNYDESETGTIFNRTTYHCRMHKARCRAVKEFWTRLKQSPEFV